MVRALHPLAVVLMAWIAASACRSERRGAPPSKPVIAVPVLAGASIVLDEWWSVSRSAGVDELQLLTRFALDPHAAAARARTSDAGVAWRRTSGAPPPDAALALTSVTLDADDVRMARLSGAGLLLVDGVPFHGDPERRGYLGVPVALHRGVNELVVADIRGAFELELWKPTSRLVIGTWDAAWPGYGSLDEDLDVTYPLFNAATSTARQIHLHYSHAVLEGSGRRPDFGEWRDGGYLAPLCMFVAGSSWATWLREPRPDPAHLQLAHLEAYEGPDPAPERIELRKPASLEPWRARSPSSVGVDPTSIAALGGRVLLIHGTQGSADIDDALLAHARFDQQCVWYATRAPALVYSDAEFLAANDRPDIRWHWGLLDDPWSRVSAVVLYGNADTNAAWTHVVGEHAPIAARDGALQVGVQEQHGDDVFGQLRRPSPNGPGGVEVFLSVATGCRGARVAPLLRTLVAPSDAVHRAFWRIDPNAPQGRCALAVR